MRKDVEAFLFPLDSKRIVISHTLKVSSLLLFSTLYLLGKCFTGLMIPARRSYSFHLRKYQL